MQGRNKRCIAGTPKKNNGTLPNTKTFSIPYWCNWELCNLFCDLFFSSDSHSHQFLCSPPPPPDISFRTVALLTCSNIRRKQPKGSFLCCFASQPSPFHFWHQNPFSEAKPQDHLEEMIDMPSESIRWQASWARSYLQGLTPGTEGLSDVKHQNMLSGSPCGWTKHMLILVLDVKLLGRFWTTVISLMKSPGMSLFWLYHVDCVLASQQIHKCQFTGTKIFEVLSDVPNALQIV